MKSPYTAGVWLAVSVATSERVGIDADTAYTIGMIVVFCGIVGARALYVMEKYGDPGSGLHSFGDAFKITEGGISIYGAIIGGAVCGWASVILGDVEPDLDCAAEMALLAAPHPEATGDQGC